MTRGHHKAVGGFGGDFETIRDRISLHDEGMISSSRKILWNVIEYRLPVVFDAHRLPVNRLWPANNLSTEELSDRLMAKAHSENGGVLGKSLDNVQRNSCVIRGSRARRDQYSIGRKFIYLVNLCLIVSKHLHIRAKLAQILNEVVRERVVIVDNNEHSRD